MQIRAEPARFLLPTKKCPASVSQPLGRCLTAGTFRGAGDEDAALKRCESQNTACEHPCAQRPRGIAARKGLPTTEALDRNGRSPKRAAAAVGAHIFLVPDPGFQIPGFQDFQAGGGGCG